VLDVASRGPVKHEVVESHYALLVAFQAVHRRCAVSCISGPLCRVPGNGSIIMRQHGAQRLGQGGVYRS
jgi:hypothetical protein